MGAIVSGRILIFHLLELADEVDLGRLRTVWADSEVGQIVPRRPQPGGAISFRDPPVVLPLGARPLNARLAGSVRAKIFDFGVASICWELDAPDTWEALLDLCAQLQEDPALEAASRQIFDEIRPRLEPACKSMIPESKLVEDYFIIYVDQLEAPTTAEALLASKGPDLAQLLRGERRELSPDERKDALRLRHSYLQEDLVVVTWNAGFVYDPDRTSEHVDILEFANAELLDLRYYDTLLDSELAEIYAQLQTPHGAFSQRGRLLKTSERLMGLMVEVFDLREKINNALKFIGDMYSARIYRLIADRLRLSEWEASVDAKLRVAQQIYQVLLEELGQARFLMLEFVIVALILLETVFFVFGRR
ncbi:MAG: hypothetical protein KGR26_03770 [Cyanobacteria bacterium REEB65]|nr:hypothetical protein [Cyanobacteria bacterium REEB65]